MQAQTVASQNFLLVDSRDHIRGRLGVDSNGQPSLDLLDLSDHVRATLTIDTDGTPSLALKVRVGGGALVSVGDTGFIQLADAGGSVIWSAP